MSRELGLYLSITNFLVKTAGASHTLVTYVGASLCSGVAELFSVCVSGSPLAVYIAKFNTYNTQNHAC